MSNADFLKYKRMEEQIASMSEKQEKYHVGDVPYQPVLVDTNGWPPPIATITMSPQDCAVYAVLTDKEKDAIRQIVAEEIAKVLPMPQKKPEVGIPDCPDCGGWILDEHDVLTPLNTAYRRWWCVCPEKVAEWEARCQQGLDDLLKAIHDPDDEIESVLAEMSGEEFEALIEKVKARRGQTT